jgi:hypothetical protein
LITSEDFAPEERLFKVTDKRLTQGGSIWLSKVCSKVSLNI